MNIPDGEVFTAPVKDSINGILTYNTPAVYQGFTFSDISLTFQDGKIIKATANDTKRINEVFDTDEGARYVGEFAIGVNPYIIHPMKDTLFDEKIMGSFHFTPGNCYEEAPNGNESSIHWDLVCIQTEEYGGGEIYFDDVLIRKNGRFVIPELYCLNPENLKQKRSSRICVLEPFLFHIAYKCISSPFKFFFHFFSIHLAAFSRNWVNGTNQSTIVAGN